MDPSYSEYSKIQIQIGQYIIGKKIGMGAFGSVKMATHILTGERVAIKILNKAKIANMNMNDKVRREVSCVL